MRSALAGHFWTLRPHIRNQVFPSTAPPDAPWEGEVADATRDATWTRRVRLSGWLADRGGASALVIVHGLGGSAESRYVRELAGHAGRRGLSYLRLNMRGADLSGEDIYHAGLTADLRTALSSPELRRFSSIFVVGYSLGGHIALRWASEAGRDPRVRALVTICSPLDLAYGAHAIQRRLSRLYEWHVLRGLKAMYRAVCRRRDEVPLSWPQAARIQSILEWDHKVVVPRFGFESRDAYYARMSAGPLLARADLPTLFIAARADPVVTADQLRPWLRNASASVEVAWTAGGHVGFPDRLDLGLGQTDRLEPQLLAWCARQ